MADDCLIYLYSYDWPNMIGHPEFGMNEPIIWVDGVSHIGIIIMGSIIIDEQRNTVAFGGQGVVTVNYGINHDNTRMHARMSGSG